MLEWSCHPILHHFLELHYLTERVPPEIYSLSRMCNQEYEFHDSAPIEIQTLERKKQFFLHEIQRPWSHTCVLLVDDRNGSLFILSIANKHVT